MRAHIYTHKLLLSLASGTAAAQQNQLRVKMKVKYEPARVCKNSNDSKGANDLFC